jgi:two-component system nitrogen regulation sensor histidine kinase NtrY
VPPSQWLFALVTAPALLAAVAGLLAAVRTRRALAATRRACQELERQVAEGRHEAERGRLRALLEATPLALVLFSETGRILDTNEAARDLLFESQSVEGLNFLALLERAPEPLRNALLSSRDELFTLAQKGERETFHLAKRPLMIGGQPHTLVAVKPIGAQVARQEVATLKRVIRSISHEINNSLGPVISLVGSARVLAGRPDGPAKLGKIFDTVEERTRHLQTFLDGYARLARIPEPRPQTAPWAPVLEALRAMWPRLRITPPAEPTGFFDSAQLQQVLINLVKNAHEAGGADGEVDLEIVRPAAGGTEVRVLDRGAGMTDEALDAVARPFYTTKPAGSGLGLTISREIIELHHGRLRLQRRDGGGMVASLWLPDREGALPSALAASRVRLDLTRA